MLDIFEGICTTPPSKIKWSTRYLAQFSNDLILGVIMLWLLSSAWNLWSWSRVGITFSSSKRENLQLEHDTACALLFSACNEQKRNSSSLWNSHRYAVFFPLNLEAEYTYQLHKDVIPLMMDYKYKPDGWLGIIVGAKFWIDFTEKHKLDSNIHVLVRELGVRGKLEAQETQKGKVKVHCSLKLSQVT